MNDAEKPEGETPAHSSSGQLPEQRLVSAQVPETLIHQREDKSEDESQQEATVEQVGDSSLPAGRRASHGGLPERFGRYRIRSKLGQGGMGAVYVAHDTQLDRQVALKVPFFGKDDGPAVIDRFYREARAMATLHHPNLCPVFDVGETDGVHFLTMALIDGRALSEELQTRAPMPPRAAASIIRKLALALQNAHESGVVHRDLKPANVMIRADSEPVIMDFGLARRRRDDEVTLTLAGTVLGTPAYMSPEQVQGDQDRVGPPTDVYALGVILYQMLTGRLPFAGSVGSILAKILTQEPTPPREFHVVDPELEAICLKAMARRIEDRYATAGELAADLQRFLKDKDSAVPRESAARSRSKAGRWRRHLSFGAGGGLLMTAVVVIAVMLSRGHDVTDDAAAPPPNAVTADPPAAVLDERWRLVPEPRRYPSFRQAVSYAPPWLLADEDAPFDIAEYFETPVWEDNAAPLYLNALAEFGSETLSCFPEAEREQRSPAVTDRMQRFYELYDRWEDDPQSVPASEIDRMLQEFETGFQLLERAQRKQECVFETGVDVTVLLPHIQAVRTVARVQQMRARREVQADQIDVVLEQLRAVLRLRRDMSHRGSEVTTLVGVAVDDIVCDRILRDVLLHPSLNETHCDLAIELLAEHERHYDEGLRRGWQGAYIMTRIVLNDLQFRSGPFSPEKLTELYTSYAFEQQPESPGAFLATVWGMDDATKVAAQLDAMSEVDFDEEVAIANVGYRSILELIDRPIFERYKLASRLWDQLARNPDSKFIRYQMPAILPTFDAHRLGMTTLIGTKCLVCLRRWQLTHTDAPPDLASVLQAAGVNGPEIDPCGDGEPLRLTWIDAEPVIYSIGPDGIDEAGRVEWNSSPGAPGDITFRLETWQELNRRRTAR